MRTFLPAVALCLCLAPLLRAQEAPSPDGPPPASDAPAQPIDVNPSETLKVNVNLVNLFFSVRDKDGYITNLHKDDCTIYEDRIPQKIKNFTQEKNLPLTIGILLDTSGSQINVLPLEQQSGAEFLKDVLTPKDEAFLISFDINVNLLADYTNSPREIKRSIDSAQINTGAGTGSVSVIDMTTNSVITINDPSFNFPVGFAYNGRYLYVANEGLGPMGDGSISVIDTRINAVTSSFTLGPPGSSSPIAIAIRENYAYVTNLIPNQVVNVAVFDTRDNTLVTYITDPSFINSDAIVISGDEGYVANSASNSITVLDLKKNTVKGVFTADLSPNPNGPVGIAVARNHIYISDYTDDVVTVVNLKNGEISTISDPFSTFKDPTGIVLTTALYDINRLQPIYQIDYADAQNKLLDAGL